MKFLILMFLVACGSESPRPRVPKTPTAPQPIPGDEDWNDIKPLVQEQCALSGCHAGAPFLATGRAMKASKSAALIRRGRMPKSSSPNFDLYNNAKKSRLLKYLE